jgi:regulator of protease activity HflC (stomatin/prohibitin superfamily)
MANVLSQESNVLLAIFGAAITVILMIIGTSGNIFYSVLVAVIVGFVLFGIHIVRPTHRVLIEFLGKYQKFGGPGIYWIVPGIQKLYAVNITEKLVDATSQEIITRDNLNATVDAQVYFKVKDDEVNVKASQYNVFNYEVQIVNLARTTLRNIIGTLSLKEANSQRSTINTELNTTLRKETGDWGIEIVRTELKEIKPPQDVQETMNKVVKAENEKIAAIDFATAVETQADGQRRAAIKQAEGQKSATILVAEGQAEAIKLVNEAANKYFIDNAQKLKALEVTQASLEKNAKFIVPAGQSVVNIIGGFGSGDNSLAGETVAAIVTGNKNMSQSHSP